VFVKVQIYETIQNANQTCLYNLMERNSTASYFALQELSANRQALKMIVKPSMQLLVLLGGDDRGRGEGRERKME